MQAHMLHYPFFGNHSVEKPRLHGTESTHGAVSERAITRPVDPRVPSLGA